MNPPESLLFPELGWLTRRSWWLVGGVILGLILGLIFNFPPAFLKPAMHEGKQLVPAAYEQKIQDPWLDLSTKGYDENSHNYKLTPRVGGALLYTWLPANVYVYFSFQFVCGLLILALTIWSVQRETGDRSVAIVTGGIIALSVGAALSFGGSKYLFDAPALVFVGLVVAFYRQPWLAALLLFLGMWVDERVLLAAPVVMLALILNHAKLQQLIMAPLFLLGSVLALLASRTALATIHAWNLSYSGESGMIYPLLENWHFLPGMIVLMLDGALVLALYALYVLAKDRAPFSCVALLGTILLLGSATLMVHDVTRTIAFCYPLVTVLVISLYQLGKSEGLRWVLILSLVVSMLIPTVKIKLIPGDVQIHTAGSLPGKVIWKVLN